MDVKKVSSPGPGKVRSGDYLLHFSKVRGLRKGTYFGYHFGVDFGSKIMKTEVQSSIEKNKKKKKPVLAREREARRKCSSAAKRVWTCWYLPAMLKQNCCKSLWNTINSAGKKTIDCYALLVPIIFKIYQICIKTLHQFWCFLGALGVPKWLRLGVHMSNSSSTGKRPTFYSKIVPKMDPKSRKMGAYFQCLFWYCSGPLLSWFCLQNRLQHGTPKATFSQTSDFAKV